MSSHNKDAFVSHVVFCVFFFNLTHLWSAAKKAEGWLNSAGSAEMAHFNSIFQKIRLPEDSFELDHVSIYPGRDPGIVMANFMLST